MNNLLNAWISLGKRRSLPELDICLSSKSLVGPQSVTPKPAPREASIRINFEPSSAKKVNSVQPKSEKPKEVKIVKPEYRELPLTIEPSTGQIHQRLRIVKEILREICLIDRINAKKYRSLDDRQRSLLNKILTYKFQPDFLDVIDTGGVKQMGTEEYLLDDPSQHAEKVLLYLRLKALFESKFLRVKHAAGASPMTVYSKQMAQHYFGGLADLEIGQGATHDCALFQEVDWIRRSAAIAVSSGCSLDWIKGMKQFLHDLLLVNHESIIANYQNELEKKLDAFFFDEDNDVHSFFAKLKVKMKEKKVRLPLTHYELKNGDQMVVKIVKNEMVLINNLLVRVSHHNEESKKPAGSVLQYDQSYKVNPQIERKDQNLRETIIDLAGTPEQF